jgi:hypothetical protein
MHWRRASGGPDSKLTPRKLLSNYKARGLPMIPLWSGILALAVINWVFLPMLNWTLIILVVLGLFVSGRQLGADPIVLRFIRLGVAGVYRSCVSPVLRGALALVAIGFIALQYYGTVLDAINLCWLLLSRLMNTLFAVSKTLLSPDGQGYLFVSIATLACLVAWRLRYRNALSNDTLTAHEHLRHLSRRFGKMVTSAETSSRNGLVREIRRGTELRPTQVWTPRLGPSSSELRIAVELGPGADVERVERLALEALRTLDRGRAVVHTLCTRQRLADGAARLQISFCVTDVARGRLHVLSDARASVWDCLHADGIAFGLRTWSSL